MTSPARVLFHSAGRRGLGHVVRSANLARALTHADPETAVLVHVTNHAAGPACGDVPWVAHATGDTESGWRRIVQAFRPSLVVFDTMLPGPWASDHAARAFVWRKSVEARHDATVADARLDAMAAIVVPHDPSEFGRTIPAHLAARTTFTGPIVRTTDAEGRARVRARYGLGDDDVVITSTVGGGGFDDSAAWLLSLVLAAHERWRTRLPRLRHLVVRGPLAASARPVVPDGITLVDADFDLVHLLAISTMVVAEAGYNTVHELRHVGTPAVLAPGPRTYDDQGERARALETIGVARVLDRAMPEAALATLVDLPCDAAALAAMRAAAMATPLAIGNETAAQALLDAAR